jgi:tripartite-type tricarboxylate transporter receptor subunit TctC
MTIPRRRFLHLAAGTAALPTLPRIAKAQTYPARPITMIVPTAAGASMDTIGRIVAGRMRRSLGQPVIIENVGGADGRLGAGRAARARPDGYTIELGFLGNHVLNGGFYSLPYDVLNDFAPISPLVTLPTVLLARKSIPAKNLDEWIVWLKASQKYLKFQLPRAPCAACSNFCVGYPRMARVPPVLLSTHRPRCGSAPSTRW